MQRAGHDPLSELVAICSYTPYSHLYPFHYRLPYQRRRVLHLVTNNKNQASPLILPTLLHDATTSLHCSLDPCPLFSNMSAPHLQPRSGPSTTAQPSHTTTTTRVEVAGTLRLRGVPAEDRRIRWAEDVVDNEGLGRKSSKGTCGFSVPTLLSGLCSLIKPWIQQIQV